MNFRPVALLMPIIMSTSLLCAADTPVKTNGRSIPHTPVSCKSEFAKISSLRDLQDKACEMKARIAELEQQLGRGDSNSSKNPKDYRKDFQGYRVGDLRDACCILKGQITELETELGIQGSSSIVGTPSMSRSPSSNNFSVDDSSLLPRKIDFREGGLNHGASDYEIVAKKSQIINALKHWIDSSLYTSGGDAGKLLQDYVDQHQPSDDSVDSVWKDVSGIETRGSFKSRLEEIIEAVPLQTVQNPTEQKLSVIKAVCDWIDEISPGEDTKDFLKYDPLRAPAGQRIHHFPDARNPDAPTDKSKGAFKMAIRAKILEAF